MVYKVVLNDGRIKVQELKVSDELVRYITHGMVLILALVDKKRQKLNGLMFRALPT